MHAASASSLLARSVGDRTLQLEKSTTDLVLHGRLALLVVNWSSMATGEEATAVARSSAGGSHMASSARGGVAGAAAVRASSKRHVG